MAGKNPFLEDTSTAAPKSNPFLDDAPSSTEKETAPENEGILERGARALHKAGEDEPGYTYGDILPFKKNQATGERSFAVPEAIRSLARGAGDLIDYSHNKASGAPAEMTPEGVGAMLGILPGAAPVARGLTRAAEVVTHPLAHPIDATGKAIDTAMKVGKKALQPAVRAATRGVMDSDNPIIGGGLKTALESMTAKTGEDLGKRLGVNFSAGELTGNTAARGMEDALANSARWSGKFAEANTAKIDSIVGKFKQTLETLSPDGTSSAGLGEKLTSAYSKTIDSLATTRREQAKVDFARAEQATGAAPVIEPTNFIKVLSDYVAEGDSPLATPAQKAASAQASKMLSSFREKPPVPAKTFDVYGFPAPSAPIQTAPTVYKRISVRDLQNGLSAFGEGAKTSGGGIWRALATASDRRFASAAKHALEADMDVAADKGVGEGAAALKIARDRYRDISAKMTDIQQTALGKIIGSAERNSNGELVLVPEKVVARFASMEPAELRGTLRFLDTQHPDIANMARRYTLEAAYRKAFEGVGQFNQGMTKPFAKAEFLRALPSDEKLTALLGDSQSAREVRDVAAGIARMVHYGAEKKGSASAQRLDFLNTLGRWGASAIYRSVMDETLAEDLLNPTLRKALAADAKQIEKIPEAEAVTRKAPSHRLRTAAKILAPGVISAPPQQ